MSSTLVLDNARLVLPDSVVTGHVVIEDGRIAALAGKTAGHEEDLAGDFLIPGLVELHTDHIESHFLPRPRVKWNKMAAVQAHDAQIAGSGITTVFDALRTSDDGDANGWDEEMRALADVISHAVTEDRVRADHFIHLRCEVSAENAATGFEKMVGNDRLRLVSLMDHAPGQRQFLDLETYRAYYQPRLRLSDAEFDAFCRERIARSEANSPRNRALIAERCLALGIILASHDDATAGHVAEAVATGIRLAEFPTTITAAEAAHEAGMMTLMGAPNVVRGGSHSGNVSALELHRKGLLAILSSDYVPFSLLQATFLLAERGEATLPEAIALVTAHPAAAVGLNDRGRLAEGLRADLVRVRVRPGEPPVVAGVWREGRRVA
ncbi:alpha-D-ribose 1-methylphosphonate 5-triphosphate diphosphatase [Consotaella salsifontis]|uniref:Alpha-D-ribose 1-methylphosphonate 5-triphosphate diphosphatase n=1 Tax=Consotaella salsifontis TaxID=1365950 RepID=A0A1T4T8C3_9HYPH|nr:alpha-D-ribose 1-methylphosphonate 5-triphosphate diphosphatase [Consotaella salsifontis]SKA36398.1 alpha-D-ribose 1-methylphosphonate 5-triphosphate diphosphatase [Consotaella salsifontis]